MAEIVIPSLGVAMEEALLLRWLKEPGDEVTTDEAVAEIETDKTTMELTSPMNGLLGPHRFAPGAIVPVGVAIVSVLLPGEQSATPAATNDLASHGPAGDPPGGVGAPPAGAPLPEDGSARTGGRQPRALSPRAERQARQRGDS